MSLTINPTSKVLGTPTPSEFVINVQSTSDWSASTEANWIQFTPSSGTSGNATITATTGENKYDTRSGYLNFSNTQGDSASCEIQHTGLCPATVTRCGVTGDTWVNLPETEFETGAWKIRLDNVTFSKNAKSGSTLFSLNMGYDEQPDIKGFFWLGLLENGKIGIYSYYNYYSFSGTYESYIANETIEMSRDEGIVIGGTKVCDMGLQLYGGGNYAMTLFAKNAYGLGKAAANWDLIIIGSVSVFDGEGNLVYKFTPKTSNSLSDIYYCDLNGDIVSTKGGNGYAQPVEIDMENAGIKIERYTCKTLYIGDRKIEKAYLGGKTILLDEIEFITSGAGLNVAVTNTAKNFIDTGFPFKTDSQVRVEGTWRGRYNTKCIIGNADGDKFFMTSNGRASFMLNNGTIYVSGQTYSSGETLSVIVLNNKIYYSDKMASGTTATAITENRTIKIYYDSINIKKIWNQEGNASKSYIRPIKNPFKNSNTEKLIFHDNYSKRLLIGCYYNKT